MKKFKKIAVIVMIGVMLCSSVTVANAAETANGTVDLSGYSEEEMLAYYLEYEGGELHERLLIAEVMLANVSEERTLKDIIDFYLFTTSDSVWQSSIEQFDETNLDLARIAIKNHENGNDTQYDRYMFKLAFFSGGYVFTEECLETEHYVFFCTETEIITEV